MRFDEVELQGVGVVESPGRPVAEEIPLEESKTRRLFKQTLSLLTDLSLFAALTLALFPFLPQPSTTLALIALGGFVLMVSFYYFVGAWMLWGKTIGGAIFDVRVEARSVRAASLRWMWLVLALAVVGAIVTVAMR